MSNATAVRQVLSRLNGRFKKLYLRKAHIHHYLEYMELEEFDNAHHHLKNITTEYQSIEDSFETQ
jgi:tubulin epsilon